MPDHERSLVPRWANLLLCRWRGHRFSDWREVKRVVRGEVRQCRRRGCPVMEWRPDAEFRASMRRCVRDLNKAGASFKEFAQRMGKQGRYGAH